MGEVGTTRAGHGQQRCAREQEERRHGPNPEWETPNPNRAKEETNRQHRGCWLCGRKTERQWRGLVTLSAETWGGTLELIPSHCNHSGSRTEQTAGASAEAKTPLCSYNSRD